MTVSYEKLFAPTEIPSTGVTLFTQSGGTGSILRNGLIKVVNTTTTTRQVTIHVVPSGGSAGSDNMIADSVSIPVADYEPFTLPFMGVGDFLYALADADNSLTVHFEAGNLYTP